MHNPAGLPELVGCPVDCLAASLRLGAPETVLGAQEMSAIITPYGKYFSVPDNMLGGPESRAQVSLDLYKFVSLTYVDYTLVHLHTLPMLPVMRRAY